MQRRLYRALNPLTDMIVANCEACRQLVIAEEHADPERVIVIENGIDLSRFLGIPPLDAGRPFRRVGMVANLRSVKMPETLVGAAAALLPRFPELEFVIAGEGNLRPKLERRIEALGLSGRFHLPGIVHDIPTFLSRIDIAVLTSGSEGMSNALLEYMTAGRAIVATAVGGNIELIQDGAQGLLVSPGDTSALTQALQRLLQEPAQGASLGAAAREYAKRYGQDARARRFEASYQDLLPRRLRAGENRHRLNASLRLYKVAASSNESL
jgi:glycosyltransferase involved in cell wall biosynthesis